MLHLQFTPIYTVFIGMIYLSGGTFCCVCSAPQFSSLFAPDPDVLYGGLDDNLINWVQSKVDKFSF